MHITELTTPYVKRRIFEYSSGGNPNKPVRHWHEVQQVAGPLYKGRETENQFGELECNFYLLYDGVPAGLRCMRQKRVKESDTQDKYLDLLEADNMMSLTGFMENLKKDMEESCWIGLATIAFVKQFDEAMAQTLALYRQSQLEIRKQERLEEEKARQAEEAAAAEELRKEKQAQRDAFFGWADGMSELRFGQVRKIMEQKRRYDGVVMTRREFMIHLVKEGRTPVCVELDATTEYHLTDYKNNNFYLVTKTEHDFAKYLLESGQFAKLEQEKEA